MIVNLMLTIVEKQKNCRISAAERGGVGEKRHKKSTSLGGEWGTGDWTGLVFGTAGDKGLRNNSFFHMVAFGTSIYGINCLETSGREHIYFVFN